MIGGRYDDVYFEKLIERLVQTIHGYNPQMPEGLIRRAFAYASKMHGEQRRDSGEPFVVHPLMVAQILAELQMDEDTIVAALLHDCIEDTSAGFDQIAELFSKDVATLVDGVTKLDNFQFYTKDEAKAESLRKMFVAMAKDLRVVIIKLADRLHNMRTLRFRDEQKRIATSKETLEVYAPLAHRLGIFTIKSELEDLSLRFMDSPAYYELVEKVAQKKDERKSTTKELVQELEDKRAELGIKADIVGRPKHFYSIYRKMRDKDLAFEQVYDLVALRVLVGDISDCYAVLGAVHNIWKPIPGRFKDYISMPKSNMYQSLHTTVISSKGAPFEVQIRTYDMHKVAEYGIAAHWRYKEKAPSDKGDEIVKWLSEVVKEQGELSDPTEFVNMLKHDVFADMVLVFTPKGDVIDLPKGATSLDFAYRVHTEVGNRCIGAKVNSRIVTLDTQLHTGDIVEVLTSSSAKGPSMDWLKIVTTAQARSKIKAALKQNMRDQNMLTGREMLEREAKRQNCNLNALLKGDALKSMLARLTMRSLDDLYATVGFGGQSAVQVIARLQDEQQRQQKEQGLVQGALPHITLPTNMNQERLAGNGTQVNVKGMGNMLVRFANCCTPVPGDEIMGYTTRGRGVSIHRADCLSVRDVAKSPTERMRLIEVSWANANEEKSKYEAEIQLIAYDHNFALGDLANTITREGVRMMEVTAKANKDGTTAIAMVLEIHNTKQLDDLIGKLQARSDVLEVYRK